MLTVFLMILLISIITMVLFLPRLVQKNSIVINNRNVIARDCELPFVLPILGLLSFSQLQMKFVGIRKIVSKNLKKMMIRLKLQFRIRNNLNEISYKLYLGNGIKRRDGPFLGERLGAMEVSVS